MFAVAALAAAAVGVGCNRPSLRAGRLPPEFAAAPRRSQGTVNLAGIAAPGANESRIDAGDLLEVTIASGRADEESTPTLTRVSDSGAADIPLVGPVQVGGLEPFEASQNVAHFAVQRGIYRRPHVTIEIKTKAVNHVTVMGAVTTPGVHELPRASSDLVKALAMAGGLTEEAGTVVEIVRQSPPPQPRSANGVVAAAYRAGVGGRPQSVRIDLANAAASDYRLGDRDMVMVPPREKELIYVTGLVNAPGQFELPVNQEVRLLDALAMAGGVSSVVGDKVLVIRRVPGRPEPAPIGASISDAKRNGKENLVLGAGDVVSVEQTPATAVVDTLTRMIRMTVGLSGRAAVF